MFTHMQKLKVVLVDDEESARDVLENLLLRFCPQVELLAKCTNVPEAVKAIQTHQPDLVFLDIEMPRYAGYEIVEFFDEINFHIVFVTAYEHYALRAFEIAAIDYLLKPIDIERLKFAVERVQQLVNFQQQSERLELFRSSMENRKLEKIIISDKGQQFILPLTEILAVEAMESYCVIHTVTRKHTISKNLKHYETILSENDNFFRSHKSWLVNLEHLLHYSKSDLSLQLAHGIQAKLSKYKKAELDLKFH